MEFTASLVDSILRGRLAEHFDLSCFRLNAEVVDKSVFVEDGPVL